MIDDVQAFVSIAEVLKERGAYKIYVMATHGLLSSDAPRLIEESCIDEVCEMTATHYLCILTNCFIISLNIFFIVIAPWHLMS